MIEFGSISYIQIEGLRRYVDNLILTLQRFTTNYPMSNISELLKLSIYFWQGSSRSCLCYHFSHETITKIYIGNLPVSIDELRLRQAFSKYCNVTDVIVKKGNAQGQFDKFCYGFVSIACDEAQSNEIIAKISQDCPMWKMKIKDDSQSYGEKNYKPMSYQQKSYPQMYHQPMMQMNPRPNYQNPNYYGNQNQNEKGEIYGQKNIRIMVRQLWLGGIPEMMDHQTMSRFMSEFGMVEGTQIFPKFAFVKFKRSADATNAYERADRIHQLFGNNAGFRLSFSDPSRRKDIVANHYEFQRTSNYLPILFLGFPPITSANIEINHMRNVCEKFGTILNYYLKKSTNPQMRSYFLFTYDSVKTAQKAKQQLYRRKDLLGEKRVEMTLLLDEDSVLMGRELTYIDKKFGPDNAGNDKVKRSNYQTFMPPNYNNYMNPYQNMGMNQPMNNYGYQHNMYPPQNHQMQYQQPNVYYPPDYQSSKPQEVKNDQNKEMFSLIQEVLDDKPKEKLKIPPRKQDSDNENAADIISKMLGKSEGENKKEYEEGEQEEENDHRQPAWSGFIHWKMQKRAGVDGYTESGDTDFNQYSININSTISPSDLTLKQKNNIMTLEPGNSVAEPAFKNYLKMLSDRIGVSVTKNWVIFVMGSEAAKEKLKEIKDTQLLIVMQKLNIIPFIKDKITPCQDFSD